MTSQGSPLVFDTYAWVEYALGTRKAEAVSKYLEGGEEIFTPATVLAELKELMLRQRGETGRQGPSHGLREEQDRGGGRRLGTYRACREINFRNKKNVAGWGMLESFLQAVATAKKGKALTGDPTSGAWTTRCTSATSRHRTDALNRRSRSLTTQNS